MQTLVLQEPTDTRALEFSPRRIRRMDRLRERHRLLARIQRKFQTITEQIPLGPLSLTFTRTADPNRVLDDACAEEDLRERQTGVRLENPPHLPYWAELWESSRALATALTRFDILPKPRDARPWHPLNVLDLGCGMGLAGTVAAALGHRVTLADFEPPALLFARLNSLPFNATTRRVNWQTDRLNQKFDVILGADILYERAQWPFLHEFWLAHLAEGGSILLTEPHRPSGDLFIPWIQQKGWTLRQQAAQSHPHPIRLFCLNSSLRV
jgi:predicted nicotinamide N-methyase